MHASSLATIASAVLAFSTCAAGLGSNLTPRRSKSLTERRMAAIAARGQDAPKTGSEAPKPPGHVTIILGDDDDIDLENLELPQLVHTGANHGQNAHAIAEAIAAHMAELAAAAALLANMENDAGAEVPDVAPDNSLGEEQEP